MAIELLDDNLLGIPAIDDDHRRLVAEINRIGADIREASYALYIDLLAEFEQVALDHFRREEEILDRLGYPRLDDHRSYHSMLLHKVNALKSLGYEKAPKEVLFQNFTDMANFVVDDIIRGDLEFKGFLR